MNARVPLAAVGLVGEVMCGGLIFGWNALSVVLKALGVYDRSCSGDAENCSSQSSRLAVVWSTGVFAVNFGPAIVGPLLDWLGPKALAAGGAAFAATGMAMLGFLATSGSEAALPAASFVFAIGGLAYHLAQFNFSALFPQRRGFLSSLFVGAFIASGAVFQGLRALVEAQGGGASSYRRVMVAYSIAIFLLVPVMLWLAPARAVRPGETFVFVPRRFAFALIDASQQDSGAQVAAPRHMRASSASTSERDVCESSRADGQRGDTRLNLHANDARHLPSERLAGVADPADALVDGSGVGLREQADTADAALPAMTGTSSVAALRRSVHDPSDRLESGCVSARPEGSDPADAALAAVAACAASSVIAPNCRHQQVRQRASVECTRRAVAAAHGRSPIGSDRASDGGRMLAHAHDGAAAMCHSEHGCCKCSDQRAGADAVERRSECPGVRSSSVGTERVMPPTTQPSRSRPVHARWLALARRPFLQQLVSGESIHLCTFFTLNVLALQFYLGTARLQLEAHGDTSNKYTTILSFIVPGICLLCPVNAYLLDGLGYGKTALFINLCSVATIGFQMVPSLQLQVLTIIVWSLTRYLLYSSYFAMCGLLFGYKNFGRIVGVHSIFAGLVGLLQIPLTNMVVETLDGDFLPVQIASAAWVLTLFGNVFALYRWERSDVGHGALSPDRESKLIASPYDV